MGKDRDARRAAEKARKKSAKTSAKGSNSLTTAISRPATGKKKTPTMSKAAAKSFQAGLAAAKAAKEAGADLDATIRAAQIHFPKSENSDVSEGESSDGEAPNTEDVKTQ